MSPQQTGERYDRIAARWQQETSEKYGMAALDRAIRWVKQPTSALDVGCGSTGRFLTRMQEAGFAAEGLDVSAEMIRLSRERNPQAGYHQAAVHEWNPARGYSLITAWDSLFHLPLDLHRPVLEKLVAALEPGGAMLFTCGGGPAGSISGSFWNEDFDYSTLGVEAFIQILRETGCFCRHVEYDQFPENHVVILAQKAERE